MAPIFFKIQLTNKKDLSYEQRHKLYRL